MKYIIGKKFEMTQQYNDKGEVVPVTVVQAGPCIVTQIKKKDKNGYDSIQIGYGHKRHLSKSILGHLKGLGNFSVIKEFKDASDTINIGDTICVDTFESGDTVKVVGISKGKGFQGVVKRHGFSGMPASHGTKDQKRMPGSIGATGPAHVFKGTKMAGRMGNDQVTVSGLKIFKVDLENNLLYITGAIPGARNSVVYIKAEGELKVNTQVKKEEEKQVENLNTENDSQSKEVNEEVSKPEDVKTEEKKEDVKEEKTEDNQEEAKDKAKEENK